MFSVSVIVEGKVQFGEKKNLHFFRDWDLFGKTNVFSLLVHTVRKETCDIYGLFRSQFYVDKIHVFPIKILTTMNCRISYFGTTRNCCLHISLHHIHPYPSISIHIHPYPSISIHIPSHRCFMPLFVGKNPCVRFWLETYVYSAISFLY